MRTLALILLFVAGLSASTGGAAQDTAAKRELMIAARFVDVTGGSRPIEDQPVLSQKPGLDDLQAREPQAAAKDFGLAFNCEATADGALRDCRLLYGAPAATDGAALVRALSAGVRLTAGSAATAARKGYRVTIDAAVDTVDRSGMPRTCRPPFCIIEGAMPPPPPLVPVDPVAAQAMERANKCFGAAWKESGDRRFAAERALRNSPGPLAPEVALAYVRSRQQLMACIIDLQEAGRALPLSAQDRRAIADSLKGMRMSYEGQMKYETAILIGVLDKSAAEKELSYSY